MHSLIKFWGKPYLTGLRKVCSSHARQRFLESAKLHRSTTLFCRMTSRSLRSTRWRRSEDESTDSRPIWSA
jgi:hypothetical protein